MPNEVPVGILPVPRDVREANGILEHDQQIKPHNQTDAFLSKNLNTRRAILPVHTQAEFHLFRELSETNPHFIGGHWLPAAKLWNAISDRTTEEIYYKVRFSHHTHTLTTLTPTAVT